MLFINLNKEIKMKTIIDLLLNDKNINQNFKEVLKGEKNGIIKRTNGRNH